MATSLEKRVATLEEQVARLKSQLEAAERPRKDWVKEITGGFANDPAFEEAMRLGREYRESSRPRPKQRKGS